MKKIISVSMALLIAFLCFVPSFAADTSDVCKVVYHLPQNYRITQTYQKGDEITAYSYYGEYSYSALYSEGNQVLCGWSTQKDGEVEYYIGDTIPFASGYDFYPVYTTAMLDDSEFYTFRHHFETDGYYMNNEDYNRMLKSLYEVFGWNPMIVLAVPGSIVLSTMRNWKWTGSCYGISTTVMLQHLGKIDLLSAQDAQSMNDLVLDDELMSTINYYQAQAGESFLLDNHGFVPGSAVYKKQLKNLIRTVSEGNLALLTVGDPGSPLNVIADAHTVVPCGTYDRNDGTHILIVYDCNVRGFAQFIVAPDYSSIKSVDKEFGPIGWTDDFSHYNSFDINGNSDVTAWHLYFVKHIFESFKTLIEVLVGR